MATQQPKPNMKTHKDVASMLSATTSQSPLATQFSVFTMPSVSMGNAGISLIDHLFLLGVPTIGDPTHSELKDVNGLASQSLLQNSSAAGQALSNQLAAALAAGAQNQLLANLGQQGMWPNIIPYYKIPFEAREAANQFIGIYENQL